MSNQQPRQQESSGRIPIPESLPRTTARYIQTNHRTVLDLPAPDTNYSTRDVEHDHATLEKLARDGIIRLVDVEHNGGNTLNLYQTKRRAYAYAGKYAEQGNGETLPCGCRFHVKWEDSQIVCKHCGREHDPDDVRAHRRQGGDN
jgi:hypothetical protein